MPIYICEQCSFSSKIKTHYTRHINTKKHKKNIEICEEQKNNKKIIGLKPCFSCDYCNSSFISFSNKRRHELHRCKLRPSESKIVCSLKKKDNEIKSLKKQMELLLTKVGTTNNTIINNTTNNTINLNSYGKEDLSHITENLKTNLLHIPYGMIPKMIEVVHFNDKKPENKNIILTNKNDNKIKIFSGNKWIYKNKEDTIKNLINEKYFILDTHYDSINTIDDNSTEESCLIPNEIQNSMNSVLNNVINNSKDINKKNYESFRNKYDGKDKELLEKLKRECELVLLNNR